MLCGLSKKSSNFQFFLVSAKDNEIFRSVRTCRSVKSLTNSLSVKYRTFVSGMGIYGTRGIAVYMYYETTYSTNILPLTQDVNRPMQIVLI